MGPAPEALIDLSVADLFLPEKNEWNLELIGHILSFEEHMIRSLKPSLTCALDRLIWLKSETGEYTTKIGYAIVIPKYTHVTQFLQ